MSSPVRRFAVGSRGSPLSLAQTDEVLRPMRSLHPGREFVVVTISTGGDKRKDAPLLSMERGMFAKEIELALLAGEIDFAVHSAKDLPADLPEGLALGAFGARKDPRDVLVNSTGATLMQMPEGSRLGTGSPRRTAHLKALRPDIEVVPIRGNVGTRIEKARDGQYDGVVLAAAGLIRLGRQNEITEYLSPDVFTPEVGQGALAVQARSSDSEALEMLVGLDDRPTSAAVLAERAFLRTVGGGCKAPVAAYGRFEANEMRISAMAALPDGSRVVRIEMTAEPDDPESSGKRVAEALVDAGAGDIIAEDGG